MVCYCPERKILYVHLPKCAGLTIEAILIKRYGFKHFTFPDTDDPYPFLREPRGKLGIYKYILKYSNEAKIYDLNSFRKFTIVRNPYKRGVSAIRYLHKNSVKRALYEEEGKPAVKKGHFPMDIDNFYYSALNNDYHYMHFCLSQKKSLEDLDGNIDFIIGRFENLMPELRRILFTEFVFEEFNIESLHVNQSDQSLLQLNTDKVRDLIRQIHYDDFEFFGYPISE